VWQLKWLQNPETEVCHTQYLSWSSFTVSLSASIKLGRGLVLHSFTKRGGAVTVITASHFWGREFWEQRQVYLDFYGFPLHFQRKLILVFRIIQQLLLPRSFNKILYRGVRTPISQSQIPCSYLDPENGSTASGFPCHSWFLQEYSRLLSTRYCTTGFYLNFSNIFLTNSN
jgi:hypothetical protein